MPTEALESAKFSLIGAQEPDLPRPRFEDVHVEHRATNRVGFGLLICSLACASCATPTVRTLDDQNKGPVVSAEGPLPARVTERILDARVEAPHDTPEVREMVDAFRGQAATPLVAGNGVTLLVDGPQTLGAIDREIEAARQHVHVETYIFADDDIGRKLRDLLVRRRNDGLEVRVLYDAVGSLTTPASFFEPMIAAGVEVLEFRPLDPTRTLPWKINNRDHRKIVVVDGRVAFTGGINFSGTYASSSRARPGPDEGREHAWRDTHVRIEGPVVAQFQTLFFESWARAGGKVDERSPKYFPDVGAAGPDLVSAVATSGGDRSETTIYATYDATIRHATRRLWMTQAYFAPDKRFRRLLIDAARRGVDVRLIVPGFTDSALIFYASRASYEELLAGGVRIYEQQHALLHAKSMVIDTALSVVGSANFDMRSFLHNNEVNAVIIGSDFARDMEELFKRDLNDTRELELDSWRRRPLMDKLKELGSSLFSYWL